MKKPGNIERGKSASGRKITAKNVLRLLDTWPQAINADDGDLCGLHDLANAGAQAWKEKLFWPDYLWLGLEGAQACADATPVTTKNIAVVAPIGGTAASLGSISSTPIRSRPSGSYAIGHEIKCLLEVKSIIVDHVPNFRAFRQQQEWHHYLNNKLRNAFTSRLRHGDNQLRDGKRLLGLSTAAGMTIVVNEGSPGLSSAMVQAFLARALQNLPNTDGIVYLAEPPDGRGVIACCVKDPNDGRVSTFAEEFQMAMHMIDWSTCPMHIKGSPYPKLMIRVDMDERSKRMYATWSTGWRASDDPAPLPRPSLRLTIMEAESFTSGLK
jgi:hypothetical protein